jgi:hypothetical protein
MSPLGLKFNSPLIRQDFQDITAHAGRHDPFDIRFEPSIRVSGQLESGFIHAIDYVY